MLVGSAGTTGTDGADTFTSVNTAATATYGAGDVIVGGAGADVLNISVDNRTLAAATSVVGVETINVTAVGTGIVDASSYNAGGVVALGSTINLSNQQVTNSTGFTVTALGTGATVAADATVTGTLSVTTAASTAQTLTLAANKATTQTVVLTHSGDTDVATISAAGKVGLTATTVETLNFSGNGAAATYTMASVLGATANNLTGAQSVTLAGTSDNFTAKTITDNTTAGTTTLDITALTATLDLTKATVDNVTLTGNRAAAQSLKVKAGQAITSAVAHTADDITLSIDNGDTTYADGVVTLELTKEHGTGIGYAVAAKSATADNITTLNIVNNTTKQDTLEVLATADTAVVLSGSKSVTLEATSTAKSVTQTGSGVLTVNYDNADDIKTVTGGSGNDVFTNAGTAIGTEVTINGGAGNDTFTMMSTAKAVIDGGTGNDTVVLDGALDGSALKISNVEVLSLTGTAVLDVKASQLSGKNYIVTGAGANDSIEINAANSIDTLTIDLSGLQLDATNVTSVVTLGTAITAAFGATAAQTFIGSNTADTYTGNQGADTITGGNGADILTGGLGADRYILTETTAAADIVNVAAADSTATGMDTIVGYDLSATGDKIDFTWTPVTAAALGASVAASVLANANAADKATASSNAGKAILAAVDTGLIVLSGADKALVDTVDEYLGIADSLAGTTGAGSATAVSFALGFELNGNTYVVQYVDGKTGDADAAIARGAIVCLENINGSGIVTTNAADKIFIA